MNRRDLLKRGFGVAASGLLLPVEEPIRRYWQLDRTMLPSDTMHYWTSGWIDTRWPEPIERIPSHLEIYRGLAATLVPLVAVDSQQWMAVLPNYELCSISDYLAGNDLRGA